ncbi:MAG: hypothetical protein AAGB24_03225 [Bacteroidota bacterium]
MTNMLSDTSTISLILYGLLLAVTFLLLRFVYRLISKNTTLDEKKLEKIVDLFKYSMVSIAIATITLIVSDLFKERDQDIKELEYFDKYVDDVKAADGIEARFQLTKYLSIVAPSGELRKSWERYHDSTRVEFEKYKKWKKEEKELDTVMNPTKAQQDYKEELQNRIRQQEGPLVSYQKTKIPDNRTAKFFEDQGFQYLIQKDIKNAINAFILSENAQNRYNAVYDIAEYLKPLQQELSDPRSPKWKEVYREITMTNKSFGMDPEIKNTLRAMSR